MADVFERAGRLKEPVKAVPGIDFSKLALSATEGFVLSRIDDATSADFLCEITGLGREATLEILKSLRLKGVIVLGNDRPVEPPPEKLPPLDEGSAGVVRGSAEALISNEFAAPEISGEFGELDEAELLELDQEERDGIDIKREVRIKLRALDRRLADMNFFELLGISADADAKVIRRAYFKRSKQFHPDRFYTKNCGHYKDTLAKVFKQMTAANEFLQDQGKREEYRQMVVREQQEARLNADLQAQVARAESNLAATPVLGSSAPVDDAGGSRDPIVVDPLVGGDERASTYSYVGRKRKQKTPSSVERTTRVSTGEGRTAVDSAAMPRPPDPQPRSATPHQDTGAVTAPSRRITPPADDKERAARRIADRKRRKRRVTSTIDPSGGRLKKARDFFDQGMRQLGEGKSLAAAASLKLAMTYDPTVAEYEERYEEAVDASRSTTAEGFFKRALFEESVGRYEASAKLFQRAADVFPKVPYLVRATRAMLSLDEMEKAKEYASKAVKDDPGSVDARLVLAEYHLEVGERKQARREAELALKLEPRSTEAKDFVKRMRKV